MYGSCTNYETFTLPRIAKKHEHGIVRQEDKERLYCYYFAALLQTASLCLGNIVLYIQKECFKLDILIKPHVFSNFFNAK